MNVGDICSRNIAYVSPFDSVVDVARIMREQNVTSVFVVDNIQGDIRPHGIITDHDLVLEVLAAKIDPSVVRAEDILTTELISIIETQKISEALKYLHFYGVKLAPVVDINGNLVGLFSIEDALATVTEEYSELVKLLSHELVNEKH